MSKLAQAIEAAMGQFADKAQVRQVLVGTAKDVTDTTCTVERENAPTLHNVRLNAIDDELQSYVTVVPAVDSEVLVAIIENLKTEAVVIQSSEVQKVIIKIDEHTLTMDKDGFIFNGGNQNGLVKIADMVNWMGKVYQDLTVLQTQLSTHVVAGNGAPLGLVFNPATPQPVQETFENTKIKQ